MTKASTGRTLRFGLAALVLVFASCKQPTAQNGETAKKSKQALVVEPTSSGRDTAPSSDVAARTGTTTAAKKSSTESDVNPPEGVVYHKASKEVNDRAIARLKRLFSAGATDKDVAECLSTVLMCGAGVWKPLADLPEFQKIPSIPSQIIVPQFKNGKVVSKSVLPGRVFKTAESVRAFWKALAARYNLQALQIRKLNQRELRLYWAMIPYDIEEPVFMVITRDNDFLVDFSGKDLHVFALDDFRQIREVPNP